MSSAQRRSGDAYAVQNAPCVILERDTPRRYANRLTAGFAITSLFAVATGCFVVHSVGVGFGVWGRNAAAWVVGAILAGVLARIGQARHIRGVLRQTRWQIAGARGAARVLGLHPNTLRSRLVRLGIQRDA